MALADATADHAEEARAPLEAARAKWPTRVEPLIGLARLAYRLGQTDDVVRYAARGARARPRTSGGARAGDARAARRLPLRARAARSPSGWPAAARRSRSRWRWWRAPAGSTGDAAGALAAADGLLAIDPESEEGFYQRVARARRARPPRRRAAPPLARYEQFRVSLETDLALRDGWRRLHPGHADESEPCHTHRLQPAAPAPAPRVSRARR